VGVGIELAAVAGDAVGEDEVDGCMAAKVPLKKLDLPSPFRPTTRLMRGLRLLSVSYA
jgi:hypothetical protein